MCAVWCAVGGGGGRGEGGRDPHTHTLLYLAFYCGFVKYLHVSSLKEDQQSELISTHTQTSRLWIM